MSDKLTPIDLLRKFHEHANKIENHVSTDETRMAFNGDDTYMLVRKWYWESDLRKQTIDALQQIPGA